MVGTVAGAAAAVTSQTIGHAVRLKGTNIWFAHGDAVAPTRLAVRLVPAPDQSVKVQWSVVCQKKNPLDPADYIANQETSGQASVRAAATVNLALPYPKPPTCVATVYATLERNGRLTLELLQT
jgi:hypothetical protein